MKGQQKYECVWVMFDSLEKERKTKGLGLTGGWRDLVSERGGVHVMCVCAPELFVPF